MLPDNKMWFVRALRDACDRALHDGRVGDQTWQIDRIELTSVDPPRLTVITSGDYSPTECTREFVGQSVFDVMHKVADYMADRATRLYSSQALQ